MTNPFPQILTGSNPIEIPTATVAAPHIFAPDIHLEPWGPHAKADARFLETFLYAFPGALKIIGGDLVQLEFFGRPSSPITDVLAKLTGQVLEETVPIAGNHDPYRDLNRLLVNAGSAIKAKTSAISKQADGTPILYSHGHALNAFVGDKLWRRSTDRIAMHLNGWINDAFGLRGLGKRLVTPSYPNQLAVFRLEQPPNSISMVGHTHILTNLDLGGNRQLINPSSRHHEKFNGKDGYCFFQTAENDGENIRFRGWRYNENGNGLGLIVEDDKYLR